MPQEFIDEHREYLNERKLKYQEIDQDDIESELQSEREVMGQELKPYSVVLSEDEDEDKLNSFKGMCEVGKEINPNKETFVNEEGLKRVYKPKEQREAEAEAAEASMLAAN